MAVILMNSCFSYTICWYSKAHSICFLDDCEVPISLRRAAQLDKVAIGILTRLRSLRSLRVGTRLTRNLNRCFYGSADLSNDLKF